MSEALIARLKSSAEAFRKYPIYNADGDPVRLTVQADELDEAATALRAAEARVAGLEGESAELTKALTGLTCGGSEFFDRKGDRYVADAKACVEYVRQVRESQHRVIVREVGERKEAEARVATLEGQVEEARGELSPFAHIASLMDPDWPEEKVLRLVYDDPEWGDNTVLAELFTRPFRRAADFLAKLEGETP